MAGWDAAPAAVPRKHGSGTPRVTVRSNYVGLPSVAGRGRMNGGESCWDQRGRMPGVRRRKNGPEVQSRRSGAPEGEGPRA